VNRTCVLLGVRIVHNFHFDSLRLCVVSVIVARMNQLKVGAQNSGLFGFISSFKTRDQLKFKLFVKCITLACFVLLAFLSILFMSIEYPVPTWEGIFCSVLVALA
jgi:hypothetical protein